MFQLRELCRDDIPVINTWRNDPQLISQLGAPYRYINQDVDMRWYDQYMNNRNSCVRCAIVEADKPETILGLVSLTNIDQLNQSAVLHIMIGNTEAQGKGMGTFAITRMLYHAFMNLNLHRVELKVLTSNARACHTYEKVGFVREGMLRSAVYKNGGFADMYLYSILKEEFLQKHGEWA